MVESAAYRCEAVHRRIDCTSRLLVASFEGRPQALKYWGETIVNVLRQVLTAEARSYKPRLQTFEYMFDRLSCGPEQMMHVSSSFRYDLMSASDLGFMAKTFIDRAHEPTLEGYGVRRLTDIRQLPGLLGL